jgi:hypothetical protein
MRVGRTSAAKCRTGSSSHWSGYSTDFSLILLMQTLMRLPLEPVLPACGEQGCVLESSTQLQI